MNESVSPPDPKHWIMKTVISLILVLLAMSLFSMFSNADDGKPFEPYDAPSGTAMDQDGKSVSLSDIYKKGTTLVYFYPKADTPGCTAQACSLRDAYEELTKEGVHIIGVSTDGVESQKKFSTKYKLPFTLLADTEGTLTDAFKVKKIPLIGMASRQAFLIKDGKVIWHDAKASTKQQAEDVLKVLKEKA